MAIPNWFVNGDLMNNPPGGTVLCELNPPFTQHMTLEVLVHCALTRVELRHILPTEERKNTLIIANSATVYVTVEPNDILRLYWMPVQQELYVQGSIYAWR